jgi:excisionase family DNA binding protein
MSSPTPTHLPPSSAVFMTVDEVAARLGVHPATMRRWTRDGYIDCVRLGPRLVKYRRSDVERLEIEGIWR